MQKEWKYSGLCWQALPAGCSQFSKSNGVKRCLVMYVAVWTDVSVCFTTVIVAMRMLSNMTKVAFQMMHLWLFGATGQQWIWERSEVTGVLGAFAVATNSAMTTTSTLLSLQYTEQGTSPIQIVSSVMTSRAHQLSAMASSSSSSSSTETVFVMHVQWLTGLLRLVVRIWHLSLSLNALQTTVQMWHVGYVLQRTWSWVPISTPLRICASILRCVRYAIVIIIFYSSIRGTFSSKCICHPIFHILVMPMGMPKVVLHCCMIILCLPQFTFNAAFVGS